MPDVDPFTQAHTALWTAVKAWEPLSSGDTPLIRIGDRIDVTSDGQQRKRVHNARVPADVPELEIEQGPFSEVMGNSRTVRIVQMFRFYVSSGSTKIIWINKVKYEVFRALFKAGPDLGLAHLVKDWTVTGGEDLYGKSQGDREGYNAVLNINVEMYVGRDALLATT